MRELMQDEDVAVQQVAMRRCGAKQNRLFPQESCSGMFHAPIGQPRDQHHIVFREWKWLREKIGEVLHAASGDLPHLGSLGLRAVELRLAHIKFRHTRRCRQLSKWPGGESKQIGT